MATCNSSSAFRKVLQSLSSGSSSIRYHSQHALRRIFNADPGTFLNEFIKYVEEVDSLETRPLSELAFVISTFPQEKKEFLPKIQDILIKLEKICGKLSSVSCSNELISVSSNFFHIKPDLLSVLYEGADGLQILTSLAVSHLIVSTDIKVLLQVILNLLKAPIDKIYSMYARSRLISSICIYSNEKPDDMIHLMENSAGDILKFFLADPQACFAPFIPTIVSFFTPKLEERAEIFKKFISFGSANHSIAVYMITAAVSISDHSEEQSMFLIESLVPILSMIPFHFSNVLPDDISVNGFNVGVRAINSFITPETSKKITKFIVNTATTGELNQKLGFHYALTCLVKLGALIDFDELKRCFHKVSTPLEAGTLAELALALLGSGHHIMTWADMIMFFEDCYGTSNSISEPFVLDASSLLGKLIDAPISEVLTFLSHCIFERFKFAHVHISVLDGFVEKHTIQISQFPPLLNMHLCMFITLHSTSICQNILELEPSFASPLSFLEKVDANTHSTAVCSMFDRFLYKEEYHNIICQFIVKLTWNCSKQIAESNTAKIVNSIGNNLEKNVELISSLYAAFATVDCHMATQSLQVLIQSQNKGWFLFGGSNKSGLTSRLVFMTLSKLSIHKTPFIQFATEHLPDSSERQQCADVIRTLASVLKDCEEIKNEFPPKCRLFDFVMYSRDLCNNDIFRCLGELLPISPVCQIEHIPLVTNIILEAKEITTDLLFLLQKALEISESPGDIQMLIEPFIAAPSNSIQFSLLLSILEALVGDQHTTEEFPSLNYNASSKLDALNTSCDNFLTLVAKIIGLHIPTFDNSHLVAEYTLRIMSRLVKKIEVKQQLSLQDAVRCVAISFNSQCLIAAAELLCKNLTISSVTAFMILFNERESELLQCAQNFISAIFSGKQDLSSFLFDSNETLAKTATTYLSPQHFPMLKQALISSKYNHQIIDILLEFTSDKYEILVQIVNDSDLKDLIKVSLPEIQYSLVRVGIYEIDVEEWGVSESFKFIELVKSTLNDMTHEVLIRFSQQLARIKNEEALNSAITVFEPLFRNNSVQSPFKYMGPFATNLRTLPHLIKMYSDIVYLQGLFTLALSNTSSLSILIPYITNVIDWALKQVKVIKLMKRQKEPKLLSPFLPIIISAIYPENKVQKELIELAKVINGQELKTPTTYVGLIELCEYVNFDAVSPECIELLMKKSRGGDNSALVVLCALFQKHLIGSEISQELFQLILSLLEQSNDNAQTAALTCISCFPLNT